MVEHQNHNLLVEGSSPPLATNKKQTKPRQMLGLSAFLKLRAQALTLKIAVEVNSVFPAFPSNEWITAI